MKLKKNIIICCIFIFSLSIPCSIITFASQPQNTLQKNNSQPEAELQPYLINETTSIKSDFYHLGIKRIKYKNLNDILRSELISMIYLDSSLYVYWAMPEDTDYQVNYIIINEHKYENGMRLLNTDGNYRKYVFPDFEETADEQYHITEVGFQNSEGKKIKYATKISCKMGNSNGQYFFEQEAENNIVLVGMLLESIYQFDNEKGTLRDAWNNFWNNIEKKDQDQRSFYYFAFNCFDREIDRYFTPDEITEIVINYTINRYTFDGKKEDYKEAQLTRREQKIQIVTPETIHVEARDKHNSNGQAYEYNTIYKLTEADINADNNDKDKAANSNTLFTAQQAGFEWVVHFGDTQGYRYSENFTANQGDIDFTKVEDFAAIHMSYIYKGDPYSVPTDTIVDMEVMTKREQDRTESLVKQITDTVSFAVESLGNMLANAVATAACLPFSFLGGVLKNPVFKTIFITLAIVATLFLTLFIVRIIKVLMPRRTKIVQGTKRAPQVHHSDNRENSNSTDLY